MFPHPRQLIPHRRRHSTQNHNSNSLRKTIPPPLPPFPRPDPLRLYHAETPRYPNLPLYSTLRLSPASLVESAYLCHESYVYESLLRQPLDLTTTPVLGFILWYGDQLEVAVSEIRYSIISGLGASPRLVLRLGYQSRLLLRTHRSRCHRISFIKALRTAGWTQRKLQ